MVNSMGDKHVCLRREHKKKNLHGETEALTSGDTVPNETAYSLATVNISSYAVLITWPRYNNMDYSYPRLSE